MRKFTFVCLVLCVITMMSCSKKSKASDETKALVANTFSALYTGDINTYIRNSDFGGTLDSTKSSLMYLVLRKYLDEVAEKGGVKNIKPISSRMEIDSIFYVSYALNYKNGTQESCISKVKRIHGKWKVCVSE